MIKKYYLLSPGPTPVHILSGSTELAEVLSKNATLQNPHPSTGSGCLSEYAS